MHYFGNPRHTQTIVAYMILADFPEIPVKNCIVAMLLRCPIVADYLGIEITFLQH